MSKLNKQKRGRHYADAVADHIRRVKAQQLRCGAENHELDQSLGDISETIVKGTGMIDEQLKALTDLREQLTQQRGELEALKNSVSIRQTLVRGLLTDTTTMATVIQATAARLGLDLSDVEPAADDEQVTDSIAAVEKAGEAATADEAP